MTMAMHSAQGRVWGAETIEAKAAREKREAQGGNGQQEEGPFDCELERVNGEPVFVRVSDVQPEKVEWLWPDRIALGKVTVWAGDPDLGKSTTTLDIASRVTTGTGWPDCPSTPNPVGGVVLLSCEDGVADTIRPRLDAAEADVSRIVVLQGVTQRTPNSDEPTAVPFCLTHDLLALEKVIGEVENCRLAVIDPVAAYFGKVDSHRNADLRGVLGPLAGLAERMKVAIVCVHHLNKTAGTKAIYRLSGSLAIVAAARACWCTVQDKDNLARRMILPIKNNLSKLRTGLAYRLVDVNDNPVVKWEADPVPETSVDAALAPPPSEEQRTERDDAADWLRELLADGPMQSKVVYAQARQNGISERTLRRAYVGMGGKATKAGMDGGWTMGLPVEDGHETPKMATQKEVAIFDKSWPSSGEAQKPPRPPPPEIPTGHTPAGWRDHLLALAEKCALGNPEQAAEHRAEADRITRWLGTETA